MSASELTQNFPIQWLELAEIIEVGLTEPFCISCHSHEEALAVRRNFYYFRTAAIKDGTIKMFPKLQSIEVRDPKGQTAAIFEERDLTNIAELLKNALWKRKN